MIQRLMIAAGLALACIGAASAPAQIQSNDKVLRVFGNDPCPAGTICVRAPESERYRIPKALRQAAPSPGTERWADRARSLQSAGAGGTGSCTNTGPGGWTGCWAKEMRQAKAEQQVKAEQDTVPDK